MEIRLLRKDDAMLFRQLVEIFQDVFEFQPSETSTDENLTRILEREDCVVTVALLNNHVVGGLTAYLLPRYHGKKRMAYIYDVGIASSYQRSGIGTAVMNFFLTYCKENEINEAFVQADSEDTHAIAFYRRLTDNPPVQAVQFNFTT